MTKTSYDNKYGSGDRRDLIDISSNLSFTGSLGIKGLIDGTRNTNVYFSNGQNIKDRSIEFLFKERVKIKEVKITQSSSTLNGEWRIEDKRGNIFSNSFKINKPETIVQVKNMNTDHLVIRGVSGATSSGPWLYEVEFKISRFLQSKTLILSNGEYKKYEEGSPAIDAGINAIPLMTSNTAPSGVANASSVYSATYDAWKAFNGNTDEYDYWCTPASTPTGWLQYNFEKEVRIMKYVIYPAVTAKGTTETPKDWTFEGSNSGVDWKVLDTVKV